MVVSPFMLQKPNYNLRRPEETVLYQAVREALDTFLVSCDEVGRPMPSFVELLGLTLCVSKVLTIVVSKEVEKYS